MTEQEIRDNAPHGADGYIILKNGDIRYIDSKLCRSYIDGEWWYSRYSIRGKITRIKKVN